MSFSLDPPPVPRSSQKCGDIVPQTPGLRRACNQETGPASVRVCKLSSTKDPLSVCGAKKNSADQRLQADESAVRISQTHARTRQSLCRVDLKRPLLAAASVSRRRQRRCGLASVSTEHKHRDRLGMGDTHHFNDTEYLYLSVKDFNSTQLKFIKHGSSRAELK